MKQKITEFDVIRRYELSTLTQAVNSFISRDWQPYGDMTRVDGQYMLALVRYDAAPVNAPMETPANDERRIDPQL